MFKNKCAVPHASISCRWWIYWIGRQKDDFNLSPARQAAQSSALPGVDKQSAENDLTDEVHGISWHWSSLQNVERTWPNSSKVHKCPPSAKLLPVALRSACPSQEAHLEATTSGVKDTMKATDSCGATVSGSWQSLTWGSKIPVGFRGLAQENWWIFFRMRQALPQSQRHCIQECHRCSLAQPHCKSGVRYGWALLGHHGPSIALWNKNAAESQNYTGSIHQPMSALSQNATRRLNWEFTVVGGHNASRHSQTTLSPPGLWPCPSENLP